jgi:hypothetical protein
MAAFRCRVGSKCRRQLFAHVLAKAGVYADGLGNPPPRLRIQRFNWKTQMGFGSVYAKLTHSGANTAGLLASLPMRRKLRRIDLLLRQSHPLSDILRQPT